MRSILLVCSAALISLASCKAYKINELGGLPSITAMSGTGSPAPPAQPDRYTFVVFGDNRPGKGEPQPETIKEIFEDLHTMQPRPAFAISLGDIIEGKDPQAPTSEIEAQFDDFLTLARGAGVPIFNAPGNHEMDDDDDVPSERMHRIYAGNVGPDYGAFSYGNARFILLNTEAVPPAGTPPPKPPEEFSYLSSVQLAALRADLDAHRETPLVFVAMHYPLKPERDQDGLNPTDRAALLDLFQDYDNIAYVLAAHEHLYFNAADPSNISQPPPYKAGESATNYLVSGGAGAPLIEGHPGSFYHYLVFEVEGGEVSVSMKRLSSTGAGS